MVSKEAQFLIKKFHLEKQNARISFFYNSNPRTYLIVFNSTRKNAGLMKPIIKHYLNVGFMQGKKELTNFSPPIDLNLFSGNVSGQVFFIVVDMAYMQIGGTRFQESIENDIPNDNVKFYSLKEERDYKKEYREYHAKPEQKKNRAKRNSARRDAEKEGKVKKGDGKEVDHIVPLSRGGDNNKGNLQVISQRENREKGAK